MATPTYVALDKVTVSTATSTITFTGINQDYTDLVLEYAGSTASAANMFVRVGNGSLDTGSNYSLTEIVGSGSSASSSRLATQTEIKITEGLFVNTNEQCNISIDFQGYSNTTTNKTLLSRANSAAIGVQAQVSLWRSTSAINTISVYASQNFNTGSTFSLYGIATASVGAKATGGTVYSDADYFYHVFASSGTFTPLQSLSCDAFVVAGGGGGGRIVAGGGGAGGIVYSASQSLTATGYTVTVGAGGAGSTNASYSNGASGGNSQFGALTAATGGGGGGKINATGTSGGSGGGGGGTQSGFTQAGGSGSQGNNGGTANGSVSQYIGAGGGGYSAAGSANTSNAAGAGGAGTSAYSSWGIVTGTGENVSGTYYYAGGGGGGWSSAGAVSTQSGVGGYGGGGRGGWTNSSTSVDNPGVAGISTSGGGGGGAGNDVSGNNANSAGANGGSGVVIVRYAKV